MPTASCSCGRQWTSLTACHCRVCHRHFSTVKNFDAHEPSRRGCKDPATLTRTRQRDGLVTPLLKSVDRSDGPTWVSNVETEVEA